MKAREVDSKQQATASQPPNLSISQALTSKKTDVLTSERSIRNEALEQRLSAQSVACCPLWRTAQVSRKLLNPLLSSLRLLGSDVVLSDYPSRVVQRSD